MRLRFAIALGLTHLILVVVGTAEVNVAGRNPFLRLVRYYGALSGSTANYSFFAPSVGSPLRATFYFQNEKGEVQTEGTDTADRELSLRFGNIIDAFREKLHDKVVRRAVAASWSGIVLAQHPTAKKIRFVLDEYRLPTMGEFTSGAKMDWEEDYSATFEKRGAR